MHLHVQIRLHLTLLALDLLPPLLLIPVIHQLAVLVYLLPLVVVAEVVLDVVVPPERVHNCSVPTFQLLLPLRRQVLLERRAIIQLFELGGEVEALFEFLELEGVGVGEVLGVLAEVLFGVVPYQLGALQLLEAAFLQI
mmetsp:Transcript_5199/g.4774  ORF Transcript_5199/g.4774 Transcript_5199/m.4774 type:complete len:139 (-) Transcript_5199:13-429(-)